MGETIAEVVKHVQPQGGVVVGDDGSDDAEDAVRYAYDEACRRGVPLHVVRAWSILTVSRPPDVPMGMAASLAEYETEALAEQRARVDKLLGTEFAIPVEVHAVHAHAAEALIEASQTADLLVVGSRGRGGFRSLVLGSVAEQCMRHAFGPVVVVRPQHG